MTYVISDIHGCYNEYQKLLRTISFSDNKTLYVLGDVVDRGPQPIKVLRDMMCRPNVIPILGNHEYMAMKCLKILMTEITEESIGKLNKKLFGNISTWLEQGGETTLNGFRRLSREEREGVLDYLSEFSLYEEITVNGQDYVLVHAGLTGFSPERPLSDYKPHEVVLRKPNYSKVYFPDKILVSGHVPVTSIPENEYADFVYRGNNHLAIDCGVCSGGYLAAVCLDTGEEFYD